MSSSTALTKRSAETALMPPPPAPKRIKRPTQALEEEVYEDAISHIIKRDFFPGLAETDSKSEYIAALDSEDPAWIAEAGQKLRDAATPRSVDRAAKGDRDGSWTPPSGLRGTAADTPQGWTGDTPQHGQSRSPETAKEVAKVDTGMSLGEFQSRYTSEDNESFYKLVDKSNKKRGEKYAWLWAKNKIPTARQVEWQERAQQRAAAKTIEAAENGGKELATVEYVDKRKAAPDAWKSKPNNTFMFAPDSIEDSFETIQQRAEADSRMGPKEIVYENTRMPPPSLSRNVVPPSPSLSAVRDAIAGRPRLSGSELGGSEAGGGGETPRVNGYAFVDSEEPEPEPEEVRYDESTRIDLGPGDATPNPFKIRERGSREALHHRMVDRMNEKHAEKQKDNSKTPAVRGGLTPAAQRLLGKVGSSTPRARNSLGGSWELTPKSRPHIAGVTPVRK